MDDLAGLSWAPSSSSSPPAKADYSSASLRSTPVLTAQSAASISRPTSTKPLPGPGQRHDLSGSTVSSGGGGNGLDSFSSLVSFGAKKSGNTSSMSLLEQQKKMQEDKARTDLIKQQRLDDQFSGLDSLGSFGTGTSTGSNGFLPPVGRSSPSVNPPEQDDLLAGFSADAKVNRASHFPPPSSTTSLATTPSLMPSRLTPSPHRQQKLPTSASPPNDPFDLDSFEKESPFRETQKSRQKSPVTADDDDILGLLGKPVSEIKRKSPSPPPRQARPSRRRPEDEDMRSVARTPPPGKDPRDPAIAELADMGFSVEDAKRALAETDTGLDVRAAVDFLLKEAHAKSQPAGHDHSRGRKATADRDSRDEYSGQTARRGAGGRAAWQTQGEKQDVAAYAQEISGNLLKTAGSLWATGRKKVAQAINELQDDKGASDGSPKWMREAQNQQQQRSQSSRRPDDQLTDEAKMLNAGGSRKRGNLDRGAPVTRSSDDEQLVEERWRRQQARSARERWGAADQKPATAVDTRRSDLRSKVDDAEVYISPARRRPPKTAAAPTPPPRPKAAEGDLLFGTAAYPPATESRSAPPPSTRARPTNNNTPPPPQSSPAPRPSTVAPAPKPRQVPSLPQPVLSASTTSRAAGTDAFKRGDYPLALSHYTASLSGVPTAHPIRFLILTNRAIVQIKLGDSKAAIEDCDAVISGIGTSRGAGESFDVGDGTNKDMKEVWGKAVVRRAEALEHLERWLDAAAAWGLALESGVGGASASTGKSRCEKVLAPKPAAQPMAGKPPPRASKPPPRRPQTTNGIANAVSQLRAANAAADRADAEKFALHDEVEAKVLAWKGGKETNLRALIASLDSVLWEGSGWKKVGMHELVMPNKVKISYMKGIGKVHPDKISQSATVEQRMLAAAVFSTLNEAWDEFKKQNNL
ncbi:hypothetical protein DRE_00482 [Drechslerella stenobrocha 248]|uniref:UBA domain-containing protein n=1 Tax=Drechslerella stenobrocha 248 TaxID=1043628 RepID=W7HVH6_9PEZI|nr:hypothetical protein DRE_00482 [Drechslerella stenobrocha 248]